MKKLVTLIVAFLTLNTFGLEVGDTAPCVVLDGLTSEGKPMMRCIRDREKSSQGYTVVDFALTTCEACQASLPSVKWLHDCVSEFATVRSVFGDANQEDINKFLTSHKEDINYAVAFDTKQTALRAWGVHLLPTTFVLNKKNVIVYKHEGVLGKAEEIAISDVVSKPQ